MISKEEMDIIEEFRAFEAANPLPVVYAKSMLYAQNAKISPEHRKTIDVYSRFKERLGMPVGVSIEVLSLRGARLGYLKCGG